MQDEVSQEAREATKTYPRMTWAASHKHTCNLCHMDKNPADGCDCGAELIDLIRSEMMSDEHPISEWEVQFAEKIKALPMFARHRHQAERETLARMEWRDAAKDAAPKDGTRILVRNDRGTFTVEWDEDCINGWWVCPDGKHDDRPLRGSEPTHWMPLPPAPEAGQ